MTHPTLRTIVVVVGAALALAACGSDDDSSAEPTTTTAAAAASTTTTTAAPTTTTTVVPSTTAAMPLEDQTPPAALNGLEVVDESIWVASIAGNQVVEVDRTTGAIVTRVEVGAAGPDDVALGPDGAVYWTGFLDGTVGRIADGTSTTVTTIEPGVNPLGFTSDGELIVGLAVTADALYRVPDTGEPELIVADIGDLNAFAVVDDRVVGPTGGLSGPGSVTAVDLTTGEVTVVAEDLPSVTASTLGPDGLLWVLSGATGEILTVDLDSGEVSSVQQLDAGPYDNLSFSTDGTLYVSHFAEPAITVITPDGSVSRLEVGQAS